MIQLVGNFEFTFDSQSDLTDGTANQVNGLARVSSRIVAISSANHQRMITWLKETRSWKKKKYILYKSKFS